MRQVAPGARKELRSGTETAASSLMAILLGDPFGIAPRSGQLIGVDVRSPKVLATGLRLAMDLIEPAAAKHDRVHLRFMPGHHAPEATVAFPVLYAGSPHVTVDDDPGFHRHGRFGTVRLGATHDHSIKPGRMAMMLATDWPEDGGATRRKPNVFCHLHREPAHEVGPGRIETSSAVAAEAAAAHGGCVPAGQALATPEPSPSAARSGGTG